MTKFVSLYEAQIQLSSLVDRAAAGEEIVIARNGMPFAKLVPLPNRERPRESATVLSLDHIAANDREPASDRRRRGKK